MALSAGAGCGKTFVLTERFLNALDPGGKHGGNAGAEVDAELPLTLWRALESLRQARILPAYLGADYCKYYTRVRRAEAQQFHNKISQLDYDWYLRAV